MPDVVVIVVTYNSAPMIDALLDSLPAAMGPLAWRTIVVDNGSNDDTVAVVHRRGDATVVRSRNLGYSAGINRGVAEHSGPEPILVLNPDVRMTPGAVPPMLDALAGRGAGLVAPRVLDDRDHPVLSLRREPTLARALGLGRTGRPALSEYVTDPREYDVPGVVDWAVGAALLVRREVHDALEGWDESFFLYSEETDFCLRAREHGWATVYEPAAVVNHVGGQSGQSDRIHAMQIVNRVRFYRRRHHAVAGAAYWLASILGELSRVARGHDRSRAAVRALVRPSARAAELGCSDRLVPR